MACQRNIVGSPSPTGQDGVSVLTFFLFTNCDRLTKSLVVLSFLSINFQTLIITPILPTCEFGGTEITDLPINYEM